MRRACRCDDLLGAVAGIDLDRFVDEVCRRWIVRRAMADYNKALELNPNIGQAYMVRGVVYSFQKRYDLAIADFNKALELKVNSASLYNELGWTFIVSDRNVDLGITYAMKALELQMS